MYFVSSFFPIRAPGRYCIHNPNPSHHCINISRSLSKIVKYMCTYSTYIPPRVYVPVASLLMKESSTKRRKDPHQTLKKIRFLLTTSSRGERETERSKSAYPSYLYPS